MSLSTGFKWSKYSVLSLCIFKFFGSVCGQDAKDITGNWMMYFGMNKLNDKVSVHSEIQYRNHEVIPLSIEQLLLRTGLNFHVSENLIVTGGYAYIASHQYKSKQENPEVEEHRIWQQVILTNSIDRLKFEHRYRMEQRWVNEDFHLRYRYRLMLLMPINKTKIEKGAFFIGLYDEVFINDSKLFFDRNRLYGGLGYQFNKQTNIQFGFMRQQVNDFGKNYLQFSLMLNPHFGKREKD